MTHDIHHALQKLSSTGPESGNSRLEGRDIHEILSNERREFVIKALSETPTLTMRELVDEVAAREYGIAPDEVSGAQRNRVRTTLHQTHLERLERAGVIEMEGQSEISRGDAFGPVARFARAGDDLTDPGSWRSVLVSLAV